MLSRNKLTGVVAFLLAGLAALSAAAEPVKIRIQWSVAPAHITPLIPEAPKEIYRHWGKSYIVEPIRMRGSGPALQGVAAGEIEFGGMSVQAMVRGLKRARLDLVSIAQVMSNGVGEYATSEFYGRKGEFTSLKDFKGKIVAVNALGSTIDAAIQAQFGRIGLKPGRDFQVVEVRFPAMLAALESKRVDLTVLVTPFNFIAQRKGKFQKAFTMREALGPTETLQWIGKADFVEKNRAALVDFMEDNLRLRRWLYDPKNREKAVAILAKVTKRPAKNYAKWVFTKKDNYRDLDGRVDVARVQKNIDDLKRLGVLKETIDVRKHVDLSIAEEAAKRLKK